MSPKLPTHVNGTELQYAEQWKESSKYFIHRSGDEVRIGFSVGLDDENVMPIHSQVSMSVADARQLHSLLGQSLKTRHATRVRARRRSESNLIEQRMDQAAKLASLSEINVD